ncbi:PREDICTED: interferon gamma receptor 2 [Condylura cristata]|uniref:interferon gamma receptor 2 n=1 Tax=Condylura cristata TaxID=143302 RepID=UPI0006438CC0|nr:PREDICTED: interferon gamma receptor 2 [Condylura cristata]
MRPTVYWVQLKYSSSDWRNATDKYLSGVNCTNITVTWCNFTGTPTGFSTHFNVSLRVRAELGEEFSPWVTVPWFQHYRNVTIGPPKVIWVTPEEDSLAITVSPPFDIDVSLATFQYYLYYWEKTAMEQNDRETPPATKTKVEGPFSKTNLELHGLKPTSVYCLQVQAQLLGAYTGLSSPGLRSLVSCHETAADASPRLQPVIPVTMGTILLLALTSVFLILVLKYKGLVKYWFHSPPSIPLQIEEYLRNPTEPILEALDKDSSPKDDAWDSVSVIVTPEKD